MPPMTGQLTISAFADEAARHRRVDREDVDPGDVVREEQPADACRLMPVLASSSLIGWPLTRRRAPHRRSTQRDHP